MNIFKQLFAPTPLPKPTPTDTADIYKNLYPESVRYALQYRQAQLGKPEINDLLDRYVFEVVYLIIKAYADDPTCQRQLLEDLARLYVTPNWEKAQLRTLLRGYIDRLPDDVTVTGTKLAQLNRYGSDHWQNVFRDLAERIFAEDHNELPCLVAHTPLIAFHAFVDVFSNHEAMGTLLILVPAWMEDTDNPNMGYDVVLRGEEPVVRFQVKDECLFGRGKCFKRECPLHNRYCRAATFIDDTINTGTTAGKLTSFWHTEYGLTIPLERVRVITDLRGRGYPKAKA